MNTVKIATLFAFIALSSIACTSSENIRTDKAIGVGQLPSIWEEELVSIETLVHCGLGHKNLVEIPVLHGYPSREAHEAARRGEIYLSSIQGGIKVDCRTCGYQYDPRTRAWVKYDSKHTKLYEAIPETIKNLPHTRKREENSLITYKQWIQNGEVVRNSTQYWSSEPIEKIVEQLNIYFSTHGQTIQLPERSDSITDRTLDEYKWNKDGLTYTLNVLWVYGRRNQTHIDFVEIKRQTEKTFEEQNRQLREEVNRILAEEEKAKDE